MWVYTAARALPPGAKPFALIATKQTVHALLTETNVSINVGRSYLSDSSTLSVHLNNPSSVPPSTSSRSIAYARRDGQVVAGR